MAFFSEYNAIPETSTHFTSLDEVNNVVDFLFEEMIGAGSVLEDLAASGEEWLNSDKASVYFELETTPDYSCNVRWCLIYVGFPLAGWLPPLTLPPLECVGSFSIV
jgi:hypothetical protein